jgi:hypothetical protein
MYQTPGGLKRHSPQHAASLPSSAAPLRGHSGRALRLVVAAGAWGAALCLTFGLVAMVAAHGPAPAEHSASGSTGSSTEVGDESKLAPKLEGNRASFGPIIQKTFRGTGDGGDHFRLAARTPWYLHWAYHCTGTQARTFLAVSQPRSSAVVSVHEAGISGAGDASAYADSPSAALEVTSDCTWSLTVTYRR